MQLQAVRNINTSFGSQQDKKNYWGLFYVLPAVDILASAILVNKSRTGLSSVAKTSAAPLSIRTIAATRTAGTWALGLSIIGIYNVIKKAIASKSQKADNFNRNRPIASFLVDIGIITAGFIVAGKGLNKLAMNKFKKDPKYLERLNEKIIKTMKKLDDTAFNKTTLPKLTKMADNFAKKAPILAKTGRFLLANAVMIVFLLGLISLVTNSERNNKF